MSTAEKNIIQGKYKLCGILGKGHFGTVCKGIVLKTKKHVAIKLESKEVPIPSLRHESMILRHLNGKRVSSIPELIYYGLQDQYYCLVMSYYDEGCLNDSILELEHIHEWWIQSCHILNHVHAQGVVHRDIKPDHFMKKTIGENTTQWHLIDFGLATTYWDDSCDHILETREKRSTITGSPNWISTHIHKGETPVRRDDYISLVYIFIDLCLQTIDQELPWKDKYGGVENTSSATNQLYIQEKSWDCLEEYITKSILNHEEKKTFNTLIFICSRLRFSDKPPYEQIAIGDLLTTEKTNRLDLGLGSGAGLELNLDLSS